MKKRNKQAAHSCAIVRRAILLLARLLFTDRSAPSAENPATFGFMFGILLKSF
jgi:hypothetical protein